MIIKLQTFENECGLLHTHEIFRKQHFLFLMEFQQRRTLNRACLLSLAVRLCTPGDGVELVVIAILDEEVRDGRCASGACGCRN